MKEVLVISGKGGTGKTSITASFAAIAANKLLVDCDVDAADLFLVTSPTLRETYDFDGGQKAEINPSECISCAKCMDTCRFEAIKRTDDNKYAVDDSACEGCGVCALVCPVDAIAVDQSIEGKWYVSDTRMGQLVHARLNAGGENSGKLVTLIRKKAGDLADAEKVDYILVDGPPGIGCPVIASLTDTDHAVIVTEPSVSGASALKRVAKLAAYFKVPVSIIINKYDINEEKSDEIARFASEHGLKVLGRVPYHEDITKAQLNAKSVVEYSDGPAAQAIKECWTNLTELLSAG